MGERMSVAEARRLGLLEKAGLTGLKSVKPSAPARTNKNPDRHGCPQERLFFLLKQAFPEDVIQWEVGELIPGRRFRADIYVPAHRLVIEVDGFGYHRTKAAFVSDRKRNNLLEVHGYRLLKYDNGSVRKDFPRILSEVGAILGKQPKI